MTMPLFLGSIADNSSGLSADLELLDQWDILDASCTVHTERSQDWRALQRRQQELLDVARYLAPGDARLQNCHRVRVTASMPVGVFELERGGLVFSNLQTCGRMACPVCGPRIRSRRGQELQDLTRALIDQDFRAVRVDWTHAHDVDTSLAEQLDRQRALFSVMGSGRRALSQRLKPLGDYAGSRRALDYTYGAAGHHLHAHSVLYLRTSAELSEVHDVLNEAYGAAAQQVGLRVGKRAVHVAQIDAAGARYLHKPGLPLAMGHASGLTPTQLLMLAGDGDADAGQIWAEYAAAMQDLRTVNTTPGLRKRAALASLTGDGQDQQLAQVALPDTARFTHFVELADLERRGLLTAVDELLSAA